MHDPIGVLKEALGGILFWGALISLMMWVPYVGFPLFFLGVIFLTPNYRRY